MTYNPLLSLSCPANPNSEADEAVSESAVMWP